MAHLGFVIQRGEPGYPAGLEGVPDSPERIYGIGDPAALRPGLAVVGARRATPYGLAAAGLLAGWAARSGYVVVSGGALGCDQAAHEAALAAGGTTVAVMAGGADVFYPRRSSPLFWRIVESGGAVISEHPWGTEPKKWTFRSRNRIIVGISRALLVLEASLPSGTFSAVGYADECGCEVAAVPGSIFAPECRGPNHLLRNGATPIADATDLAGLLARVIGPPALSLDPWACPSKTSSDPVLRAVRSNPARPDDLARSLSTDVVSIARRLGTLEASGLVARYPDGRYGPC